MKRTIELNDEHIDQLIIGKLTEDYERINEDMQRLKGIKVQQEYLQEYQQQDLKDFRKLKKAVKRILKYYGAEL